MKKVLKSPSAKSFLNFIDTLNYPLQGEYSVYGTDEGWVSGNNEYGDIAKANFFENNSSCSIIGVLIDFVWATNGNQDIEIAVWDNDGPSSSPGSKIAGTIIGLQEIHQDIIDDQTTFISFDNPVEVSSDFYLGVILPTGTDTLALFTNTDGDTDPATAWEQWSDNSWYAYDDPSSWEMKLSHAIFPIVSYPFDLFVDFSASIYTVVQGQSVTFIDQSFGTPTSWQWTFEGGDPTTSDLQSPTITYLNAGTYDVSLTISNGDTTASLTKENLITVVEEIQNEPDTLLYPLNGNFVIFVDNVNGGYVCGTNSYNDQAKVNYYHVSEDLKITGLLFDFLLATGGNPNINLNIYNNNGDGGGPGSILSTSTVELNTIKSNITNQMMTYVPVNPPVSINHPFYAGFELPTAVGDTLVVWSNDDGDTNPGLAWEQWEDGNWYAFNAPPSWELNIALAIHPIVEYQTGINDPFENNSIPVYPNPTSGIFIVEISAQDAVKSLELINSIGQSILTFSSLNYSEQLEVNIENEDNGIYFIRITTDNKVFLQKIIKN